LTGEHRLRRTQRLASRDVSLALKEGRLTRQPRLHLYLRPNSLDCARLALIVPKKLAPRAVDRNRVRRLTRETFRLSQARFGGFDLVVRLVRPCKPEPMTADELETLLNRARHAVDRP
jgi:ribonuclease P protein component